MKILFLVTAHNSLSQRVHLSLDSSGYEVSIEYALSDEAMLEALDLFEPDIVLCPFLTTRVPKELYSRVLTLILHPGPPGDVGPSALDWLLMGDDGTIADANETLQHLDSGPVGPGCTHWGVTVLEAIEDFDAGPVWAFEQFPVDIDQPGLTKSELYRGAVTRAAVSAVRCAIDRVKNTAMGRRLSFGRMSMMPYSPNLRPEVSYGELSVTDNLPFQGGRTHDRPLLKAAHREFDTDRHTAQQVSRRVRCGDSQPGVLSKVFGRSLYIYGGTIEDNHSGRQPVQLQGTTTKVLGVRDEAICIATCDGKGVWISHVRRPKGKDPALWPKVPAVSCLEQLGVLTAASIRDLRWPSTCDWSPASWSTYQEIWVDFDVDRNCNRTAYLYFEFYNGAMSTDQCARLIDAMAYIISESTAENPVHAVALMGGSYFSNGIALNVIEAAEDAAKESWFNIFRIDDVVEYLLRKFPAHNILTIAAIRGNVAAGGVALAAACDIAIAGSEVVLNPAYRAIGLSGSEYHTLTYFARCGEANATKILRSMTPISPFEAQRISLIDYIFPGTGKELEDYIRSHISLLLQPGCLERGMWKRNVDLSPSTLRYIRLMELLEMSRDFFSARAVRYHGRRFDFVRKVKPVATPLRFAKHRRQADTSRADIEETDEFDDVEYFRRSAEEQLFARLKDQMREPRKMSLSRKISVVSLTAPVPIPPVDIGASTKESLFGCYYTPTSVMMTPPETPLEMPMEAHMYLERSFFGGLEATLKTV